MAGGGGTFGFVMEATVVALPSLKIQTLFVNLSPQHAAKGSETLRKFRQIQFDNQLRWSKEGWGTLELDGFAVLAGPKLNSTAGQASVKVSTRFLPNFSSQST